MKTEKRSEGIALLILNFNATTWGLVVNAMPQSLYPQARAPVPTVQEDAWTTGSIGLEVETRKSPARTRVRTPNHPACSKSLYQIHYPSPAHSWKYFWNKIEIRILNSTQCPQRQICISSSKSLLLFITDLKNWLSFQAVMWFQPYFLCTAICWGKWNEVSNYNFVKWQESWKWEYISKKALYSATHYTDCLCTMFNWRSQVYEQISSVFCYN
jgi:hypothetical protein